MRAYNVCVFAVSAMMVTAAHAQGKPDRVRINNLSDVAFGTIFNSTIDRSISQSICVYVRPDISLYDVTATGSGAGGAFTLSSGGNTLAYEVQWAASAGQTTGTALNAGLPLSNQANASTHNGCNGSGPSTTASLITIVRATEIGLASSGSYSGTLTLLVAPS